MPYNDAMAARNESRRAEVRQLIESGHTVSQIATELGVTRQRASQLVHKAGYEFALRLHKTKRFIDSSRKPNKINQTL